MRSTFGKSYRLIAYVGRGKDDPTPLWSGNEGFQNFGTIFNNRPDWSQFAVLLLPDGKYLCVDLWEVKLDMDRLDLLIPDSLSFDDLDAAVVTAQLKL